MPTPAEIAVEWIGTPYHHRARVKGQGADCGQLVIACFTDSGWINETVDPGHYPNDWHLHREEERYVSFVEQYLRCVGEYDRAEDVPAYLPESSDVAVFKVGRTFSHGGMVTEWPTMIHAYYPSGIVEPCNILHSTLHDRRIRIYRRDRA